MGNICVAKVEQLSPKQAKPQQKQKSLKSSMKTEDHENIENAASEIPIRETSYAAKFNFDNSFNKKNEIGAYFCGGSVQECNAISYHQRMQDFDKIMKKGKVDQNKKKEKQKKKLYNNDKMQEDFSRSFTQFNGIMSRLMSVSHKELQKCIKKGVPIKYRWESWKSHLMQISDINLTQSSSLFKSYQSSESKEEVQIEKDINRTFPSQPYFATKQLIHSQRDNDTINGYLPLKRVLVSISNMYPKLGYCQGMNFILGFILMINGAKEEEAFWMFKVLAEHPDFMLMGLYEDTLPLLKFLEYVTKKVLQEYSKELMDFFEVNDIPDSFWITKWILTLFLYSFPVKICSRFWDYLITNDIFSIIKLFIPLLDVFKKEFMNQQDACAFMECFTQLTQDEKKLTDPKSEFYINITEIVKKADSYRIEKKTIAKYACQYLKFHESNNEYARLYSYYDQKAEFQKVHAELVLSKIKAPMLLSCVPEERDNNESSSITKQELSQLKKSMVEGSDMIKNCSIQLTKSQMINDKSGQDSIKHSDTKTSTQTDGLSNMDTGVDISIKFSGKSPKKNQQADLSDEIKLTSSQSDNYTEMPSTRHISQLKMLPQLPENPENENCEAMESDSENSEVSNENNTSKEEDDSGEEEDYMPGQELNMEKKDSSYHKHFRKSKTINEHSAALTFDCESYQLFQSLMNKSIDTSLVNKRSSIGFHQSIDPSDDNENDLYVMEETNNDNFDRSKMLENQSQILIHTSTLSSQNDLSKVDVNPANKNKNQITVKKDIMMFSSILSEDKNNHTEIQKYKLS